MNYLEMKTMFAQLSRRGDLSASNQNTTNCFTLAQYEVQRKARRLSAFELALSTTPLVNGRFTLPTGFEEFKVLKAGERTVEPKSLEFIFDFVERSGLPSYYAINGNEAVCAPQSGSVFGVYFQKIPFLTADADTNWVSDNWPDVYIFGALAQSGAWIKDEKTLLLWDSKYKEVLAQMLADDEIKQYSGKTLSMRAR